MTTEIQTADLAIRPDRTTFIVYFGVLAAMFMAITDMQIVVTALPTIAAELGRLDLFGWVGSSYLLSTAAVSPFYGKLGDMFGRKPVLLVAIALFLVGSLLSGMAWSMEALIGARIIQGLGGGGLMVSAFAVIGELFNPRDRAKYQGYSSAVFALASILGPVAGGYITAAVGWRWVFLVNLPIGIVVLTLIMLAMRRKSSEKHHRIDYAGGGLLALATTAIVYWCDHVSSPNGPDFLTFALPVIGVAAMLVFIMVERRAAEPIIPLRLFANPTVSLTIAASVVAGIGTLGMFFYFALYMQTLTGLSPAEVGFLFLPASISSMLTSMLAGRAIAGTGRYKWFVVLGMAVGLVTMLVFTLMTRDTALWAVALMMAAFGISLGLGMQTLIVAVQNGAPQKDIGAATGLLTQARTIGASLGLALNGAVLHWALQQQQAKLPAEIVAHLPGGLVNLAPQTAAKLPADIAHQALAGFTAGFDTMFVFVAGVYGLGLILSLLLKDVQIPKRATS